MRNPISIRPTSQPHVFTIHLDRIKLGVAVKGAKAAYLHAPSKAVRRFKNWNALEAHLMDLGLSVLSRRAKREQEQGVRKCA